MSNATISVKPSFEVTSDLIKRFDRLVSKSDEGCWLWIGHKNPKGYGLFTIHVGKCRSYRAHRVAYKLATGVYPDRLFVCHVCDNPACVKPAHLFLGTSAENTADRDRKGRGAKAFGAANPQAKLNPDAVREIRRCGLSQRKAAERFGVSRKTISNVLRRQVWGHVQ